MPPSQQDKIISFPVTLEHIKRGRTILHGASGCPVAVAAAEYTGRYALVGWIEASIYWGDTKQVTKTVARKVGTVYRLAKETSRRVKDYDDTGTMEPFVAVLEKI